MKENKSGSTDVEEMKKEFEDFTDVIGGFGKWQKMLIWILASFLITTSSNNTNWPFLAKKVEFWCARTPKYFNLTVEEWRNLSAPVENKESETVYSGCETYDIDNAENRKNVSKISCYSWEYDHLQYKRSIIEEWNLVCEDSWLSSLAGSAYYFGTFVSAIVSGQVSDRFGRRPVVASCLIIHITFGFICAFSPYFWLYTVSRFLLSVGVTGSFLSFFTYVMESVGTTYREKVIVLHTFFYSAGMLLNTGMCWFLKDWTYIQIYSTLPSILSLLFIRFIPESPRWLLTRGRLQNAEEVIRQIMKKNEKNVADLTEVVEELYRKIKNKKNRSIKYLYLIRKKELRKVTFILYILWIVLIFDVYVLTLNADITGVNIFLLFALYALLNFLVSGFLHVILPRFGRRRILLFSCFVIGISSFLIMAVTNDLIWLTIVFILLSKFFAAVSTSTIYGVTPELYPTIVRNVGIGSCSTIARIGSIVAPFMKDLSEKVYWGLPFALLGILNIIAGLCIFPLPETKSVRLDACIVNNRRRVEENEGGASVLTKWKE